jgi:predicted nucleic acid-binding Zn ribbon protein
VVEEDHRHCKVCGKVCPVGEETCSKACRTKRAQQLRTRQTYTYLIYGAIVLILIVFLLSYR